LLAVFTFLTVNLCCPTAFGQVIPETDSRNGSAVVGKTSAPVLKSCPDFHNPLWLAFAKLDQE